MPVVSIYKPLGLTPLQALNLMRERYPQYKDSVLSYAGRLDPLAEGVMLVLVDEANQEREKYLGLDKYYEFEVLFGISTDTGDLMGLIEQVGESLDLDIDDLKSTLETLVGRRVQDYPEYSSPRIDGKNFSKEIEIYQAKILEIRNISADELVQTAVQRVGLVSGEFRQENIKAGWRDLLAQKSGNKYTIARICIKSSTGTYVRVLAQEIGQCFGLPALAFSIKRTKVGTVGEGVCLLLV